MTRPSGEVLATLALTASRAAAAYARTARPAGRVEVAATKSSPTDPVTEIDRATERLIRDHIAADRPGDTILGEEGGEALAGETGPAGDTGVRWIVDPIDGTVNFVYGLPQSAVAVAAEIDGVVEAACVIDITTGHEYTAVRGEGAYLRESPARPSVRLRSVAPPSASQALVATGFNYVPEVRARQASAVARMLLEIRDIRRMGSAALDLCALAAGRFDAYVEQGLAPWDIAAGGLIARESGVVVSGLDGPPDARLVVAAPEAFAEEFMRLVRACGF
ncbi:inositol monophosphatase [Mumia sp. zg.B53]|uniref:inositol monophosphatase family protein n=1 Tax=unclassified Mumia TaxID=2621872 RepID=UPI001C6E59F3|nr:MULTISPECIES: inositol monophosphatase family protein [unclassified Mumia]MBW9205285.1 inositol monophosphatase [Mumia sp. zg.B17]MBW9208716.1 inositol monophosphatase [Mumia sp. zg.B21]MBW9213327.1 inositol monophosphatase [Mumia sp. zg.B53]MDD9349180.1 inositol monophosphatase family protein [Mumia sp.]